MTRELTLIRHAKSSWDDSSLQDFDRPLNKRGFKNAPEMGKRLARRNHRTDIIISSPAVRAITTAEIIASEINFDKNNILHEPAIYEAGLNSLVNVVASIGDNYRHAILVGHNPGLTYLCNYLCNAQLDNMPTCSIVQIKFNIDTWRAISKHEGEMVNFDYPKKK